MGLSASSSVASVGCGWRAWGLRLVGVFVFAAVALVLLPAAAWAAPAWLLDEAAPAGVGGSNWYSSVVIDGAGRPHVAYRGSATVSSQIMYVYYDGSRWRGEASATGPDNVSSAVGLGGAGTGYLMSLALDSQGRPHIAFATSGDRYRLRYASWTGTTWTVETVEDGPATGGAWTGMFPSLALDSAGVPHISYIDCRAASESRACPATADGNGSLVYATRAGGVWSRTTVDAASTAVSVDGKTSLVLDGGGRPRVAYYDRSGSELKYTGLDAGVWRTPYVVASPASIGLSMALHDGMPRIAYIAGSSLVYASYDGGSWSVNTLLASSSSMSLGSGYTGAMPVLGVDGSDVPHVALIATGRLPGGAWDTAGVWYGQGSFTGDGAPQRISAASYADYYPSLALTTRGLPGVTYFKRPDGSSTAGPLIFAHLVDDQSITFAAIGAKSYGDPDFELGATASSGLTVSYRSLTPSVCTVAGNTAQIVAAGDCTIVAAQGGDYNYHAAPEVQQTFAIAKASQVITFTSVPPAHPVIGAGYVLSATGGASGNPLRFSRDSSSSPGTCSLAGNVVSITGFGKCVIDANQAGNGNYEAAAQVQQVLLIGTKAYLDAVLADGPLGYWRLGDALDTSVMSDATGRYPGTYKNGAGGSPQLGISGDGSTTALFVGNGQYGYVNDLRAPQHAFTMEAWVLPGQAAAGMIMQQGASGALYIDTAGRYAFVPNSNDVHTQVIDTNDGDVVPAGGAAGFHHVVGTWDGKLATLYVDGRKVGSTESQQAPSGAATLYIGYGTLGPWFDGYIDEAAYYDHALSADRVLAHYQADPPPPLLTPTRTGGSAAGLTITRVSVSGASANLTVRCTGNRGARCKATLRLTITQTTKITDRKTHRVKLATRVITLASTTVTLNSGQRKTVKITLNPAGQRLLKRSHTLKVKLTHGRKTITTLTFKTATHSR